MIWTKRLFGSLLLIVQLALSQEVNTEIYLLDLKEENSSLVVSNPRNISNNPGYDNQPAFQSRNLVLFSANNGGQTDIAQYSIKFGKRFWLHQDSLASQYSPQPIPGSPHLMSVHLKPSGYQRLFKHHLTSGAYSEAHPELRVAYYAMMDEDRMLASVLGLGDLHLVWADFKMGQLDTLLNKAGRSIHKVPGRDNLSYTALNEQGNFDIFQFEPESRESFFVAQLPIGIQDHIWLDDARMLLGSGSKLYLYDPFTQAEWIEIADLADYGIDNISRLAISPDLRHLALVAEPTGND